jgi:DNA repair exonuclease SbcCD ATPase subunit
MRNADEALDILEEKLTLALHRLRLAEHDNLEFKDRLRRYKWLEDEYKRLQEENSTLKNRLKNLQQIDHKFDAMEKENQQLKDRIDTLKGLETENRELIARLNEERRRVEQIKASYDKLEEEAKSLRKIRDSVRNRVIQLIAKLEGEQSHSSTDEQLKSTKDETQSGSGEKEGFEESISFYKEDKASSSDTDIDSDINFFIEEEPDDDGQNNLSSSSSNKDKPDGEQENLF